MSVRTCPRGHRITGQNAAAYSYRGKWHTRCRRCYNAYMRKYARTHAGRLNRLRRARNKR